MNLGTYRLIDNDINACDTVYILNEIKKDIQKKNKSLISPLASYTLVYAHFDKNLRSVLSRYDFLLPDSQWIKRFLNHFYNIHIRNTITGTDLMRSLCDFSQKKNYRIFLYGTTESTLDKLKNQLVQDYPDLSICGMQPSLFRNLTDKEKNTLCSDVDRADTDILFTALGSPFQEIFTYHLLYGSIHLKKPVVAIPVGAAFDFISRVKPKAPTWMQKSGFEWLYRFMYEPRRLWKRYLIYGFLFVWVAFYQPHKAKK